MKTKLYIIFFIFIFSLRYNAQDRFDILEQKLIEVGKVSPGINDKVDLSINGVSIQEFIRAVGFQNNLNVNIDPTIDIKIVNSFSKVSAQEVFLFLCKTYNLDINFVGPILSFIKYTSPLTIPKIIEKKNKCYLRENIRFIKF